MTPPPPLTAEQLLKHGRSLRRLARGLLMDEAAAEDVVQDAMVLALERPPGERARFAGWLHTVVRSLALKRLRGERRRLSREEVAARPEQAVSTLHSIEHTALCKRLVDAVLELDEPYRSTISMRYFEGLPPREIALRLQIPKNTVRARLQRGLGQLRLRLDGDSEGGRESWAPALFSFAGLERGRVAAAVAPATSGGAFGVLTMTSTSKWILGVFALLAVGFGAFKATDLEQGGLAPEASPEIAAILPSPHLQNVGSALDQNDRQELNAPGAASGASFAGRQAPEWRTSIRYPFELRGTVVDSWGRPGAHWSVHAALPGQRFNSSSTTDRQGEFVLRFQGATPSVDLSLIVRQHSGAMSGMRIVQMTSGVTHRAHLHIKYVPYKKLMGRPAVLGLGALDRAPGLSGRPAAPVRFHSASGVSMELPEEPIVVDIEFSDHNESDAGTPYLVGFSGVILRADGEPAAGALVGAQRAGASYGAWVKTNSFGEYQIDELKPGEYSLRAGGDDLGLAKATLTLGEGEHQVWSPWLDRGRELRGRLVVPEGAETLYLVQVEEAGGKGQWSDSTLTDRDGRFAFPNAPAGRLRLVVLGMTVQPWGIPLHVEKGLLASGSVREIRLSSEQLRTGSIAWTLADDSGEPVVAAEVRLISSATGRGVFLADDPRQAGRYVASGLPAGRYLLEANSAPLGWIDLGSIGLREGQALELGTSRFAKPGLLIARADPQDTRDAAHWEIVHLGRQVDSFAWSEWPLDAWEWADLEAPGWSKVQLPSGSYVLGVSGENTGKAWFPFRIEGGAETSLQLPLDQLAQVSLRFPTLPSTASTAMLKVAETGSGAVVMEKSLPAGGRQFRMNLLPGKYHAQLVLLGEVLAEESFETHASVARTVNLKRSPQAGD